MDQWISFPPSPSSQDQQEEWSPAPPKRPAGRTKFKETRHPVYRGVRTRGAAGRWVCEIRVPGKRGKRLWLGTYLTAESAARGHDAAMLMLRGSYPVATCLLNFPDSAWLLDVPCTLPADLGDVRHAALAAVADLQRREAADGAVNVPDIDDAVFSLATTSQPCANNGVLLGVFDDFEVPVATGSGLFELDVSGDMELGMYYADLAEGLLMEPPSPVPDAGASLESRDYGHGGSADADLWSCY
ncbi:dehydration-responsive element-binding protein 1H [Brachypodium distachyon]|uniref:AP2/ERF domain-containing protein n=1 Tax=Brachypodium distachyon TaxID=15368 RepID=I1H3W8_BRADI|nr:dehydration-responsive element-binding protein 1H [Brachypodium distachyon]KQK20983.1 hypothetical protein BRADI_1g57970v3 [Brachypodium distachyon]|eukprot:XP_024313162.1 dehydration-responsive element-binding protein 1H [Brachypodium distachyon]